MKDPICGMETDKSSKFKSTYKGKVYYLCSSSCKQKFDKNPETYANS